MIAKKKKKKKYKIRLADNLDVLRKMRGNSISACICDPPYGLSKHKTKDIKEALKCWLEGKEYEIKQRGGFMGKSWDKFVSGPEIFKEIYRVLKPGGYLLCFAGARTQDLMSIAIRLAGFECRDEVSILSWNYGSGFPKSRDVGRSIDMELCDLPGRHFMRKLPHESKRNLGDHICPKTPEGNEHQGEGTGLKPAHEPILVFRKPLEEKTVAANVLKHGTGGINVDGCRISTEENLGGGAYAKNPTPRAGKDVWSGNRKSDSKVFQRGGAGEYQQPSGRWPTNTILIHHPDCRKIGTKKVKNPSGSVSGKEKSEWTKDVYSKPTKRKKFKKHGDKDGKEIVEEWECVDGCPVKEMDRQSGKSKDGIAVQRHGKGQHIGGRHGIYSGADGEVKSDVGYGGSGGASRFFPQFQYCAKANKKEKNEGLPEGMKNTWPTVKPVKLMRWLVRLVTPPNGIVLDPFMGTGSTGVACLEEGFRFLGIEKELEAFEIAEKRLEHAAKKKIT